jgi:AAA domain-containing protein
LEGAGKLKNTENGNGRASDWLKFRDQLAQLGEDVDPRTIERMAVAVLHHQRNGQATTTLKNWTDLQVQSFPPITYLVEPVLPQSALVCISAPTGSAKTFYAIDLGFSVGLAGKRVLFVVLEGYPTHASRIVAWKAHRGIASSTSIDTVSYCPPQMALNLLDEVSVARLCRHIDQTGPYDFVVIDNLNECMPGDENDAGVVGQAMVALRKVQRCLDTSATVLVLDNFGHSAKRLRGHSKKGDSFDTVVYMRRVNDDGSETGTDDDEEPLERVRVTCGKERNGAKFKRFHLRFELVTGTDAGVLVPARPPQDPLLAAMVPGHVYTAATLADMVGKHRETVIRRLERYVERGEMVKHDGRPVAWSRVIHEIDLIEEEDQEEIRNMEKNRA